MRGFGGGVTEPLVQPVDLLDRERYEMYEAAKAEWITLHPDATPKEYTEAMQFFARRYEL